MSESLRVLSWNVHYPKFANNPNYAVEYFNNTKPDVICIQEYCNAKDDVVVQWFTDNGYIQEYMPFAHNLDGFSQGVMTAVKKSLRPSSETVTLRDNGPRMFRNFPNIRGLIKTTVSIDGVDIDILNTHLTLARPYTMDMRKQEFEKLVETLDSLETESDNPMVLVGDFNFIPLDRRRKLLEKRYASFGGNTETKTWYWRGKKGFISANLDAVYWDSDKIHIDGELGELIGYDHRPLNLVATL